MVNEKRKEHKKIVLLKDRLDYIFENFSSNFNSAGKKFLVKLAKNNYNNLFFEIDDLVIRSYDFLENVGRLYDLFIKLVNENETVLDSSSTQLDLTKIMFSLKSIISKKIKNITDKSEKRKKRNFCCTK